MTETSGQRQDGRPTQMMTHELVASAQDVSMTDLPGVAASNIGAYSRTYLNLYEKPSRTVERGGAQHEIIPYEVDLLPVFAIETSSAPDTECRYYMMDGQSVSAWLKLYRESQLANSKDLKGGTSGSKAAIESWLQTAWTKLFRGNIPLHIRGGVNDKADELISEFATLGFKETVTSNIKPAKSESLLKLRPSRNAEDLEVTFRCTPPIQSQFNAFFEKHHLGYMTDQSSTTATSNPDDDPWVAMKSQDA